MRLVSETGEMLEVKPVSRVNVVEPGGPIEDALTALRVGSPMKRVAEAEFELSEGSGVREVRIIACRGGMDGFVFDGGASTAWRPIGGLGVWLPRLGEGASNLQWASIIGDQCFVPGGRSLAMASAAAAYLEAM
jgi:hypothetical protein